jgi:cytochrome c biogenesis protein
MSTIEENVLAAAGAPPKVPTAVAAGPSLFTRILRLACSVKLGVTLLCLLGLACLIGMLVMQQNVDGFENYYAALTPAQKYLYGKLGFFNIYYVWYFNALLCLVSLNIILASIDRFPKSWIFISKPQVTVPVRWLRDQSVNSEFEMAGTPAEIAPQVEAKLKANGWRRTFTAARNGKTYVFGDSGAWNRLGAYPVHVALLTIFLGGFLTAQMGTTGDLPLAPGESSNLMYETVVDLDNVKQITKQLPFEVTFTDIEQKLIRKEGSLGAGNTIDWITRFTIKDEGTDYEGMVQMNKPLDYRGYRFFQASFTSIGRARNITLDVTPEGGTAPQQITIPRNGTAELGDGTKVRFAEFRGNFRMGMEDPNEDTSSYQNPAAVLQVVPPGGTMQTAYAFGPQTGNIPIASKAIGGYTFRLADFEKVADRHILSVQRDPGASVVYVGFALLFITLSAVFFFAHQRVWVAIEPGTDGTSKLIAAGNTNRNENSLEERFQRFVEALGSQRSEK